MATQEVAKDGVVRIPKSVFQSAPSVSAVGDCHSTSSSSSGVHFLSSGSMKTLVKRLNGTMQEITTGVPPTNPNFVPRAAWPGGKLVTNDKLEVQLRFYERKGIPLTPELEAKKAELAAAGKELPPAGKASGVKARVGKGAKAKGGDGKAKGGDGKPAATVEAPKAAPEVKAWFKSRPKGGVKVLSGTDGALTGGAKRSADEAGATEEPPKKQQQLSAQ